MADPCKKSRRKGGRGIRRTRGGQPTPPKPPVHYPATITMGDGKIVSVIAKYTQPRVRGTISFHLPISLMGGYRPHGNYAPGSGAIMHDTGGRRGGL